MFERFTDDAKTVVVTAQRRARELGHDSIGVDHLLLGVLDVPAGEPLRTAGLTIEGVLAMCPPTDLVLDGPPPFAEEAKATLELALRESMRLRHRLVGAGHVAIALCRQPALLLLLDRLGMDTQQLPIRLADAARTEIDAAETAAQSPEEGGMRCGHCGADLLETMVTRSERITEGRGAYLRTFRVCTACGEEVAPHHRP